MNALIIAGLGLGIGALLLFNIKKQTTPELEFPEGPTQWDIAGAQNLVELDTFYQLMNIAFTTKQITIEEYRQLYTAYQDRFYQLVGGG